MIKIIPPVLSYILGSIPFGFIAARVVKNIDIRNYGSGNIGATNVSRVVGKKWGITVFILDFLKGLFAPLLTFLFIETPSNTLIIVTAVAAVCGHNWTIFLKFKGGKGVSTSLGVIAGVCFMEYRLLYLFLIAVSAWLAVFYILKIVSVASLVSTFLFFVFSLIFPVGAECRIFAFLIFVFVAARHKDNICLLLRREERHF